jgi:hypothetical protein
MAKKKVVDIDSDSDDLDDYEDETMPHQVIKDKYMEDIAEILSQAYSDISEKVDELLEALDNK